MFSPRAADWSLSGLPTDQMCQSFTVTASPLLAGLAPDSLFRRLPVTDRRNERFTATNNKPPEPIPNQTFEQKRPIRNSRDSDLAPICRPSRECEPRLVLSDDHMTLSLHCAGETFSVKLPAPPVSDDTLVPLFWLSIMTNTNPASLEAYLTQFPNGKFKALAEVWLSTQRTPPQEATDAPNFTTDWARTHSPGCGRILTLDVSMTTGTVKITVVGVLSLASNGQATFSARLGGVSFETSVGAQPTHAAVWDALFWHSISNNTAQVELETYLEAVEGRAPDLRALRGEVVADAGEIDFDMINRATDHVSAGRYRSPFGYILVDEFQDISPGRAALLKALLDQSVGAQLFAVGDDWQAIFRFARSDIAVMRGFEERFGTGAARRQGGLASC